MLQEFKKFAMRGSVVDLAIGVIIGAAFGKIISSMVDDILMPIIGAIFGGLDFSNYFIGLTAASSEATTYDAAKKAGATLGEISDAGVALLLKADTRKLELLDLSENALTPAGQRRLTRALGKKLTLRLDDQHAEDDQGWLYYGEME